jgi:hypothetical protein
MKILCGKLNCVVKLANVSARWSSYPRSTFALRTTRAHVSKFYRTLKLSAEDICLLPGTCTCMVIDHTQQVLKLSKLISITDLIHLIQKPSVKVSGQSERRQRSV